MAKRRFPPLPAAAPVVHLDRPALVPSDEFVRTCVEVLRPFVRPIFGHPLDENRETGNTVPQHPGSGSDGG